MSSISCISLSTSISIYSYCSTSLANLSTIHHHHCDVIQWDLQHKCDKEVSHSYWQELSSTKKLDPWRLYECMWCCLEWQFCILSTIITTIIHISIITRSHYLLLAALSTQRYSANTEWEQNETVKKIKKLRGKISTC